MTRVLWIVALAGALLCFVGGVAYTLVAWRAHGHLGLVGGLVLLAAALLLWVFARYLRFRIDEALHAARAESAPADSEPLRG
ncbi:MAG TPA: hypothetical protein VG893_06810 [Terracidiphilus sp.]|nr:hypothetical protein [Terracidiphilus sp.]